VFLDSSKAFDKLLNKRLIEKLENRRRAKSFIRTNTTLYH